VDISFARLVNWDALPLTIETFVDDELLMDMEERDILSLSGRRCN
jgi:poly(A) polymerase Pap1